MGTQRYRGGVPNPDHYRFRRTLAGVTSEPRRQYIRWRLIALLLVGTLSGLFAAAAIRSAAEPCHTEVTYLPGGKVMTCLICCYEGGNCTRQCW